MLKKARCDRSETGTTGGAGLSAGIVQYGVNLCLYWIRAGAQAFKEDIPVNGNKWSSAEAELLSIKHLAQVLGCSPKTVQDWLYKERRNPGSDPLPYYKLQGLIRFRLDEVMAWIARRRVRISVLSNL